MRDGRSPSLPSPASGGGLRGGLRVLCVILCLLCGEAFFDAAGAAAPDTVFLEELTWTELRDQIKTGKTVIIVPVGGTEQNGPFMALGKHNFRVRALAERIARALGNALVAPVVAYVPEGSIDPPSGHMRFPGTISIPEPAFEQMLEGAARSFRHAGFRDIVLIGDHGGYQAGLRRVADRLNREWTGSPERAHAIEDYYRASEDEFREALAKQGYGAAEAGRHAGLADTSLTLAIDPRLVRMNEIRAAGKVANTDGIDGDPTRSSAELGRPAIEAVVAKTVAAIRRATQR
jgi:creatinine amidohydrolase